MRKAIFLDRDGVINKIFIKNNLPFSPSSFDLLEILPGVKESIKRLKKLNFICLLITNQPDVSRGKIETLVKCCVTSALYVVSPFGTTDTKF